MSDTSLDPYVRVFKPDLSPYTTAVGQRHDPRCRRAVQSATRCASRRRSSSSTCSSRLPVAQPGPDHSWPWTGRRCEIDTLRLVGDDTALDRRRQRRSRTPGAVAAGRRRRQPGGAAGLHARRPQLGPRRRLGADRRHRGAADRLGPGAADRGTPAPFLVSACARGPERRRHVQRLGHPARRSRLHDAAQRQARRRTGEVRRPRSGWSATNCREFDVTATGQDMRLRFPEGMRSVVDATLALQGPATAPMLSGTVTRQERQLDARVRHVGATSSRFGGDTVGLPTPTGAVASRRHAAAALRRPDRRAVDAAHRERPGARSSPAAS